MIIITSIGLLHIKDLVETITMIGVSEATNELLIQQQQYQNTLD